MVHSFQVQFNILSHLLLIAFTTRRLISFPEHEFIYQSADKNIVHYDCKTGLQKAITNKLNTVS